MASYQQRQALGTYGEDLAARHLVAEGMRILERNYRCRFGEIDIVAVDGDTVVVCEVKTRSGLGYGTPAEAITKAKAHRLRRLAAHWMNEHRVRSAGLRIDVVTIVVPRNGPAQVERIEGIS